ncbi:MAG TPA: maleylpyruvate isomerase family mycothiol-dependent enzyme, partial [Streptosporangiaceae bacterium]
MTTSPMTEPDLMPAITAERQDLADLLGGLPEGAWDAPTLCDGWRVRELVAHLTMPFRYSGARFVAELARSGGRFGAVADRCARRDAARIPAEGLLAALRDNVTNPWKPPGGGLTGALTHDVVHGLDMTVPLGVGRRVPKERLRIVLASVTGASALKH